MRRDRPGLPKNEALRRKFAVATEANLGPAFNGLTEGMAGSRLECA
jgi:hypothetical protein